MMLVTEPGEGKARHLNPLVTLLVSPAASPLGMPQAAATFVGTCSRDRIDCVSGVSVPEVLEGEGSVSQASGWGWAQVAWPGTSTRCTYRG